MPGRDRARPKGAKALLIDDDAEFAELMGLAFAASGYDVRIATSGLEGLRAFRKETPDLVITDIVMPDREGIELIVEMKALAPAVRVIAVTGWNPGTIDVLAMASILGADAGLMKPFSAPELLAEADRILERRRGTETCPARS
jgi:DNA-binding response OmpR family regulator